MRRPTRLVAIALAATLVSTAGCGDDAPAPPSCVGRLEPRTTPEDGAWVRAVLREGKQTKVVEAGRKGKTWVVPADPRRVVSTLPGITEIVGYLEALDRLVAVSPWCDTPPSVDLLPRVSVQPIAWEQLTELQPDLVLVDPTLLAADMEELQRRVPAVLPVESTSLEHLRTSIRMLGDVFGTPRAREQALRFSRRLDDALNQAQRPEGVPPPRVLVLAQTDPPFALGPGSLLDDMLRATGALDLACDMGRASGPFAPELVRTRRPDWILTTHERLGDAWTNRWADVPAVQNEHAVLADANDLVRAGPRTPDALVRLADVLYGRASPDVLSEGP